ncbi:MAG: right-handed parallel beta-helix repeat-containing protein [Lentisphaerae bacterium]|nr:right-handed parallel beta-helix repeat-containing protein [Lentisphaerota bacterium]
MSRNVQATFFVATDGNNEWSGRMPEPNDSGTDGPFATLRCARDAVRELKAEQEGLTEPVTVMVRGGKYYLETTFDLTAADSGTVECPVTYCAYPGETPIISGGRPITGWEVHKDKILKCELPETKGGEWSFRQLFMNGQRLDRSRYPNPAPQDDLWNGKWAQSQPDCSALDASIPYIVWKEDGAFPREWAKPSQGELFLLPTEPKWGDSCMIRIKSIDRDAGIIRLVHSTRDFEANPIFWPKEYHRPDACRFIVENMLEELDRPGEWCLDGEDGVLYFWPPDDDLGDSEVVAPLLKRLVFMRRAAHVRISGFVFTETKAGEPSSHYHDVEGVGAMNPQMDWEYCGETLYLNSCISCQIENNRITVVGGNGIYLRHHNELNLIRGNEISYAGANGVVLAGARKAFAYGAVAARPLYPHPAFNEVSDNTIHHCGLYDTYAAGVFLGMGNWNRIIHNEIRDLPHHGINLGNSRYGRQFLEYNRIIRTCLVSSDHGAINCWHEVPVDDDPPGHVIRYNYIADTGNPESGIVMGIYLDNWSSQCLVQGNIIVNTMPGDRSYSILVKGKNNIIENNILVDAGIAHICMMAHCFYPEFATVIARNIMCDTTGKLPAFIDLADAENPWKVVAESSNNLFVKAGTDDPVITKMVPLSKEHGEMYGGGEPAEWLHMAEWRRAYGRDEDVYDARSLVADPLFVNATGGDYRLKPESPALALGFQPIPIERIGIRGER